MCRSHYVHSSLQVDHLMALLPGVNVTNVISNAPGVLVRGVGSLPAKVRFWRVDARYFLKLSWWMASCHVLCSMFCG